MSKYRDILSSHPKFLSHVLSGMDSSTLVGFRRDLRQISNSSPDGKAPTPSLFTNQLDPLNAFYHTHDGRLVIDCKCRTAERRSSQTGSSGAPSLNQ
ncbi:hypothetical protein F5Y12DRAFT_729226 [Xylaria sp. FL1777]|nr:hypothetical protein F5Y12DRAFT_729226 [Xylaria sp. FL1777]